MRVKCFLYLLFLLPGYLVAQEGPQYPISQIADSLKSNAAAVVRLDNVSLDVHNIHRCSYSEEKVISILNSSMEYLADVKVWYDEEREGIKTFKAWIYDADGKMVKHLNKADGTDYSSTPGYVLAGTQRVKYWDLKKLKAPYTIRYICEKELTGTFQLPSWIPAETAGISIEHAGFHVTSGEDVSLNYKVAGMADNNTNPQNLMWEVNGFSAVKKNEFSPKFWTILPHVLLMAKEFEIYGFKGSSKTWNDIGLFSNTLTKSREKLDNNNDDPRLTDIINLKTDDKEKVRLLYNYLQSNFRYVCISLGIGGWQPQEAAFTMQKKYGDCKALSMVMKAMLKRAGIESCLIWITAGDNNQIDLEPDFPHSYFNHNILCVPLPNDTIWLECTSATSPFNYLGSFTSDRRALMIFEGGARVVNTPVYGENDNISHSKSQIKLNADNSVSMLSNVTKTCELQDDLRSIINQKDSKNTESALYESAHLKNTTINSYSITKVEPDKPVVSFALDLKNENTVKKTEARLFVKTDLFNPVYHIPEKNDHRIQKIHVSTGYTQSDTLVFSLPVGYTPESFRAGEEKEVKDQFGYAKVSLKYAAETGELTLVRKFCLKHAVYAPEQYQPYREFLLKALKLCCPELVLKKQS